MIVATAGHVDHGKTSLIKHLTGVDTDSLDEEKRRGLTIELGFAYRRINVDTTLGFIDVPGHSRFINTMIGGVGGIDLGMLVVAADDGPMPQTREHLDVMRLLGVAKIFVVVSKIDRVDGRRLDAVMQAVRALVPESEQQVFPVSNTSKAGIAELQEWLDERALAFKARSLAGNFRLPVDRAFTLKGVGLVVTGSVVSGQVGVGDELEVLPGGAKVRVRSVRIQNTKASCGRAGDRCALNIVGESNVTRGSTLATVVSLGSTTHIDARFSLLASAQHSLKHLTPVKLYMGTRRISCRIFFIDNIESGRLNPGSAALVQLILREAVVCCTGDHFLIRDDSESITLGGGVVLDPAAPVQGKSQQHRLRYLAAMQQPTRAMSLSALLATGMPPINVTLLRKSWNTSQQDLAGLLNEVSAHCFGSNSNEFAVSTSHWKEVQSLLLSLLDKWHNDNPQSKGVGVLALQALFIHTEVKGAGEILFKAVIAGLLRDGNLALAGGLINAVNHQAVLSSKDQTHWNQLRKVLAKRGVLIPTVLELATETGIEQEEIRCALQAAARIKLVYKINEGRYGLAEHLLEHVVIVQGLSQQEVGLTVVHYKNRIDCGRKMAIDILEYFDALRFTQRRGNVRVVINPDISALEFYR